MTVRAEEDPSELKKCEVLGFFSDKVTVNSHPLRLECVTTGFKYLDLPFQMKPVICNYMLFSGSVNADSFASCC